MSIPSEQEILQLLRTGTGEERIRFVKSLPESGFKSVALQFAADENAGMVIVALGPMAQQFCYGANPAIGERLVAALHERALEISQFEGHGLMPTTFSSLASNHLKALSLLGKNEELLNAAGRYIPYYESMPEPENLPTLKTLRIEALVNLQRFDEAEKALEKEPALFHDPINGIEIQRLNRAVKQAKTPSLKVGHTPVSVPSDPAAMNEMVNKMMDLLGGSGEANPLLNLLEQFKSTAGLDPEKPEDYEKLARSLNAGESLLTAGDENSEVGVRGKIRRATEIFLHGRQPSREQILSSLRDVEFGLEWSTKMGIAHLVNDSLWGIFLCNARLKDSSKAADALIGLRNNLEERRKGIKNPLERAGIFGQYRYLFHSLCEHLWRSKRPAELLEAIESSKGRVIADRLTQQQSEVVPDSRIYSSVAALPRLTRKYGFHYISFFLDEERIYGVLVDTTGGLHIAPEISLGEKAVRRAARAVAPEEWGKQRGLNKNPNTSEVLAGVVEWLSPLVDAGILARNDHLVLCLDDHLHNVPFHYLKFREGIVLDWFSVSKVHSAFEIDHVLEGEDSGKAPAKYAGFAVWTREDENPEIRKAFGAPLKFLSKKLSGKDLVAEAATIEAVRSEALSDRIVHFSTHGWFAEGNPYRRSYLQMATAKGLPSRISLESAFDEAEQHAIDIENRYGALTPRFIVENLDLSHSHVSVMACLAGLAVEGAGGDALGLDWAFLQAGASSLLSTHWAVESQCAAALFEGFYGKWLARKKGRAAAARETMLELIGKDRSPESLQKWAGFSLTGDFR